MKLEHQFVVKIRELQDKYKDEINLNKIDYFDDIDFTSPSSKKI